MCRFRSVMKCFLNDEDGATMVEYGLMVALIAAVCITAVTTLGGSLTSKFSDVNAGFTAS
jgi:pilus assembly protein Flp/PilA